MERTDQVLRILKNYLFRIVLALYLTREAIDVIIPGAKRAEQVLHNLKTLEVHLTNEEIQEIDPIFS